MTTYKEFLTPEEFLEERPTFTNYSSEEIQEGINSATQILNALCNGLIAEVCEFNIVEDRTTLDTTNSLYRSDYELTCLKVAFVMQTQYTINLGNDFTIGSNSMSTGGLNASFQRPESRPIYAPGVKEQLAAARVYQLQSYFDFGNPQCENKKKPLFLTMDTAQLEFVSKYQPSAPVGSVLTVNQSNVLQATSPADIDFAITKAEKILDPNDNEYKDITNIDNIAWISGLNKNVDTPQEVTDKIDTAIEKLPTTRLISIYGGQVLTFQTDYDYQQFKLKTKTTDNDFTSLYIQGSTWLYKYCPNDIYQRAIYTLNATDIEVSNGKTLSEFVTETETSLTNINTKIEELEIQNETLTNKFNDYVDLTTTQSVSGLKTFTVPVTLTSNSKTVPPLVMKQSVACPFTRYQDINGNEIAMVGYLTTPNVTNRIWSLTGMKDIQYLNGDQTIWSAKSLVTKEYVDNVVQNGGGTVDLTDIENNITTLTNNVTTLTNSVTTNTTNIATLTTANTTNANNITALTGRVTTNENNIATLLSKKTGSTIKMVQVEYGLSAASWGQTGLYVYLISNIPIPTGADYTKIIAVVPNVDWNTYNTIMSWEIYNATSITWRMFSNSSQVGPTIALRIYYYEDN